jgi:hypothetical protein
MMALRRVMEYAWWGKTNGAAQAPLALNNEDILALNAAGTGTVGLIKADASDVVTIGNSAVIATPGTGATAIVTVGGTQTLTNKKLSDSTTTIVDQADATKAIRFEASGVTAGQTRVLTAPDFDGTLATRAGTETLTNKTLTANINADTVRCTTQFDATSGDTGTTLTNVVGMVYTVVPGVYRFYVNLPGVATTNSGLKVGFKYTTTVLTSIEASSRAFTASSVVVQHTTTATDQATLIGSTTAIIDTVIEGTMVVGTGGTIQLQAAQNASHADTTSVYVGASMTFTRMS